VAELRGASNIRPALAEIEARLDGILELSVMPPHLLRAVGN
jgi:hypothetical protein